MRDSRGKGVGMRDQDPPPPLPDPVENLAARSRKKPQEVTNVTASRKKAQEVLRVQPKKLVVLVLV